MKTQPYIMKRTEKFPWLWCESNHVFREYWLIDLGVNLEPLGQQTIYRTNTTTSAFDLTIGRGDKFENFDLIFPHS